jgi:NAD(P)-dependent dehydrogenase (short-subunit alcohol dehydrogenase family)
MGALAGKVALITGGGSGLGLAIVRRFVAEGARVGVIECAQERAAALYREFPIESLCITVGDVRNIADNQRAVAETCAKFGRLDCFVGNAGIYDNRVRFNDIAPEQLGVAFDELFGINVKGYLLGAKAAAGALKASRGSMLFTASVSSSTPGFGGVLYLAAKHAIVGLTKQLAWELAPEIRVNAVAPGYVPSDLQGMQALGQQSPRRPPPQAAQLPLQVLPTAEDYTAYYVLLASETGARTATGTVLYADHGLSVFGMDHPASWGRSGAGDAPA